MRIYFDPSLMHPRVQSFALSPGIMCLAPHMESPMLPIYVLAESLPGAAGLKLAARSSPATLRTNPFIPTSATFDFPTTQQESNPPCPLRCMGRADSPHTLDVPYKPLVTPPVRTYRILLASGSRNTLPGWRCAKEKRPLSRYE